MLRKRDKNISKTILEFERLKEILDLGEISNIKSLQDVGKYLYDNLFEVEGIRKTKRFRGQEEDVECFQSDCYRIFVDGRMEYNNSLIQNWHSLSNMLDAFKAYLVAAHELNGALKQICNIIKTEK